MLLRNIKPSCRFMQRYEMIITQLGNKYIEAQIITGTHVGKKVIHNSAGGGVTSHHARGDFLSPARAEEGLPPIAHRGVLLCLARAGGGVTSHQHEEMLHARPMRGEALPPIARVRLASDFACRVALLRSWSPVAVSSSHGLLLSFPQTAPTVVAMRLDNTLEAPPVRRLGPTVDAQGTRGRDPRPRETRRYRRVAR